MSLRTPSQVCGNLQIRILFQKWFMVAEMKFYLRDGKLALLYSPQTADGDHNTPTKDTCPTWVDTNNYYYFCQ